MWFRGYRVEKIQETIRFYGNNFIQLKGLGFTCTLEKMVKLKLIGAKFGEVPFMLRYDQKQSKMVTSITTLGYLVMTLLYHWPWSGWRTTIRQNYQDWSILMTDLEQVRNSGKTTRFGLANQHISLVQKPFEEHRRVYLADCFAGDFDIALPSPTT